MSKLNAFLAAIPANGLPSPTKELGVPPNKAFPSLSIPQVEDHDDDGMILVDEPQKVAQPTTPQPQFHRRHGGQKGARGTSVRDIARRFDSQKGFSAPPPLCVESNNSNQEDDDASAHAPPKPSLPPLCPAVPQANTPNAKKGRSSSLSRSLDDGEAGPLMRLNVTHQLQQLQQQQGQHHRRISTDTAMFSKLLKKQPDEDIDASVVQFFTQLPVPTISRPEQLGSSNQADEPHDVDPLELLALFQRGETIAVATALAILQRATDVMTLEPNVVAVRAPVTVVGDLHGQFSDLVELLRVHGAPSPHNPYLFLGDYVDRGVASCEIILLLLACKAAWPQHLHLLRGNHECRALSTFYGFRAECLAKYGLAVYNRTVKCFESMPLAATIETAQGRFLAVHGGLSPSIERVEQINELVDRFTEPDPRGALCDLLWADPAKETEAQSEAFAPNAVRGCSFTFNEAVCREFLARNQLLAIIRAHELEERGFREHFHATQDERLPPVITVFSAPEYCNINHNLGATLAIAYDGPELLNYRQHKRSTDREQPFTGPSEADAIKTLLATELPFLPVDFYALVNVCRQLQATLDVAASIATPVPSSASNVVQETKQEETEGRRSVDRTTTTTPNDAPALPPVTVTPPVTYVRINKPRRRASTGSGLRLCPGFMRFCEKYLGLQFHEPPRSASCIIEPKKRRSIDDIQVGTTNAPAPVTVTVATEATAKPKIEVFTPAQWTALRLYFSLLDVSGTGVLMEESFVVLLAEQDSDAYATQDELALLMDVVDSNSDGLVTPHDFLQFAYRACLHWKKAATRGAPKL